MDSRILVVDANQHSASATAQFLAEAGYKSKAVTTFEEALSEVSRECPDLIYTAVRLGKFNGLHLALRCHADHPELPVLVMGVGSDATLAEEAAKYDVRFVMKPVTYHEVLLLVRELLAGGPDPELRAPDSGDHKINLPRSTS